MTRLPLKAFRVLLLLTVSASFILPAVVVQLFGLLRKKTGTRLAALLTMAWSKAMCRVLGIRLSVSGYASQFSGFTVSNHVSYLDILVIGSLKPPVFISKNEVSGWPGIGLLARLGGTIFLNRNSARDSRGVLPGAEKVLDSGVSLVVFPEGTSTNGNNVLAFKSMVFNIPAERRIPVMPVSIKYGPVNGRESGAAWYGDIDFLPHLWELLGAWTIEAMVCLNDPIHCMDGDSISTARKKLASNSRESVEAGLLELADFNLTVMES